MNTYNHDYWQIDARNQSPHTRVALVIHWRCTGTDADGNTRTQIGTESLGAPSDDPIEFKAMIPGFMPLLDDDDNVVMVMAPVLDDEGEPVLDDDDAPVMEATDKVVYTTEKNPAAHTQRKGWMPDGFEAEREAALDSALAQLALDKEEDACSVA